MLTIMTALCMMAAPVCGAVSEVMQTAVVAHAAGSGECGENVTWTLDDTGTLTISGTGEMDRGPYWVNPLSARAKPRRSQTISDTPRPAFPDAGRQSVKKSDAGFGAVAPIGVQGPKAPLYSPTGE